MSLRYSPTTIERVSVMADHLDKSAAEPRVVVDASLTETRKRDFGPLTRQFKPSRAR